MVLDLDLFTLTFCSTSSMLTYSSTFKAVGGQAGGTVSMELLDLYGETVTETLLGQVVRISIKYYPNGEDVMTS